MSETRRHYTGQQIEVSFDTRRCIHAAECVRRLPAVFDTQRRPWIMPDGASADEVAAVVERCPSGALRYTRHDGKPEEAVPTQASVQLVANGPLYVHGQVRLVYANGSVHSEEPRMALCRCGQSQNKPFCDNSHRSAGFSDAGIVTASDESAEGDGSLTVRPLASGPLLLQGRFTLSSADGSATYAANNAALCRCGGSARKPFCDGTHREIGFCDEEVAHGE